MDNYLGFPIYYYIHSEHDLSKFRQLLDGREDHSLPDDSGNTSLHIAIKKLQENTSVIQQLISSGADVNVTNHMGLTPLHFAVMYRKQRVVEALIQAGALINAKDSQGKTPLHHAVNSWTCRKSKFILNYTVNLWIIQTLLQNENTDYNAVDLNGDTSLMDAIKNDQCRAAIFLLRTGANPTISNNISETPLHVAFSQRSGNLIYQLLLHGASIYAIDNKGHTPLDILIKNTRHNNWRHTVKILKIIAFKYHVTESLKQELKCVPQVSQFLNNYADEVHLMRSDFISDKLTVHDFISNCFDKSNFQNPELELYKPVVERLIMGIYPAFFEEIFQVVRQGNLCEVLALISISRRTVKRNPDLIQLFSNMDISFIFSKYFSDRDILHLIIAISNVKIVESLRNLHERCNNIVLDPHLL